jgi:hypothetical protein
MFRLGLAVGGGLIAGAYTAAVALLTGDAVWAAGALAAVIVGLALWWVGGDEDLGEP